MSYPDCSDVPSDLVWDEEHAAYCQRISMSEWRTMFGEFRPPKSGYEFRINFVPATEIDEVDTGYGGDAR